METLGKLSDLTTLQANGAFGPHIGAALFLIFCSLALLILPGALAATGVLRQRVRQAAKLRLLPVAAPLSVAKPGRAGERRKVA